MRAAAVQLNSTDDTERNLATLSDAATKERENLMPYIVDCCHSYATVGEMVSTMKKHWGEFREPAEAR